MKLTFQGKSEEKKGVSEVILCRSIQRNGEKNITYLEWRSWWEKEAEQNA